MLNTLNKTYLLISLFLYIILMPKISGDYLLINFVSILSIISYYSILYINSNINIKNYKKTYLSVEVFIYSLFFISTYNFMSYFYSGDFFVFNKADALFYHEHTIQMLDMPIGKAIDHYLGYMGTDDLGMILILYPLYNIVESNLILNFLYLFVGVLTALGIFNISKQVMTRKYAFLTSLSYSLSSFVLYFHSIGLKESFMVMLVVLSFSFYYRFMKSKNMINLIIALIFISSLLLFRPVVSVLIITAIGLGSLVSKKGGIGIKIISILIVIFLIFNGNFILTAIDRYMAGGFEMLIYAKGAEGMIIGSLPFTYAVNVLAQIIGPLPTLISSEKIILTFYGPGLIYRVLLAFPFWLGIIYIYKTKSYKVYPLMIFVLMEMSALAFLLEGLELRKALPHMPIVFIIAFWFLDQYDNKFIVFKRKKRFKYFFKISIFLLSMIILYWNFK